MISATKRTLFENLWGAGLATLIAWWATYYAFFPTLPWLPDALSAAVAFLVGFGLIGWLLLPRAGELASVGLRRPPASAFLCLLLLLPAYPIGAFLQGVVRAAMGGAPVPTEFEVPRNFFLSETGAGSLAAAILCLAASTIVMEWFFRGVLLTGLRVRLGARRALLLTSALSTAAFVGLRATPAEWIPVAVAAFFWSMLLGLSRQTTGSLWIAVLLHAGLAAQWAVDTLLSGKEGAGWVPGGAVLVSSAVAVGIGLWLLRRWARDVQERSVQVFPPATPVSDGAEKRVRCPWVGIGIGAGVLVGECVTVLQGMLEAYTRSGLWKALGQSLLLYVAVGAAIDVLTQLALPRRFRRSPWVRAIPLLALAVVAEHWAAAWLFGGMAVVPVAAVWAWTLRARWSRPLAGAMAACVLTYALPEPSSSQPIEVVAKPRADAPSFLVVVMDTVRRDHCSLYGYKRPTTPVLEGLAKRGVRFDRAYSSSCWSIDSHGSLLTGLLPHSHGATFEHTGLREDVPTLASTLASHGYETVGFSANPFISPGTGMTHGFSEFLDLWEPFVTKRALMGVQLATRFGPFARDKGGSVVIAGFREWLAERDPKTPFFAFINLMEAHAPYQDAPLYRKFTDPSLSEADLEAIGRESNEAQWLGGRVRPEHQATNIDLLDGAIASADAYLGRILELIDDGTYVVALSDHGDLAGEHGLYGHLTGLYQPLIRIPLVMAGPGIPRGTAIDGLVSIMDILPTLLSFARVPAPATDGRDLSPVIRGTEPLSERPMVAEHYRNSALSAWRINRTEEELAHLRARKSAVVSATRKRIVAEDGTDLGFNLETDPDELRPFPGAETGLAASVPPEPAVRGPVQLDPGQEEALRSLGYIK